MKIHKYFHPHTPTPPHPHTPTRKMKTLRTGLIGAGRIGQLHARNIAYHVPGMELTVVSDVVVDAAHELATELSVGSVEASYRDVLASPDLDAVVICTSTDTHSEIIEAAAAAGKHIFCEKPIDFNLDRIERSLSAVERAGVKLQIGFNRRFDANPRRIKAAIDGGEIGEIHRAHMISRDPAPPPPEYIERSGGLFLDMTIHDFDMARFLMGCEATEVYAMAGVRVDPRIGELGDVDTAVLVFRFENDAIVSIENSRRSGYGYDQRIEVFGSKGSIEGQNAFPNRVVQRGEAGVTRDQPVYFFLERYSESFVAEMQSFVDAVVNDTPVSVNGEDGRMPVVMGLAAKKSVDENRPVKLAEIV